jgi:hypothetical protein
MIHVVLASVVSTLNEFIRNELNLQEDVVILTNAVDLSGNLNSQIDNKLCLFLHNIDEERVIRNGGYQTFAGANPPKHFNLHVMFLANFPDPNYLEGLRYISLVLEFFQGTQVFNKFNLPTLSTNVERLSFEFVNFTFDELNSVWSVLGLKYMPSASYKIKLLSFTNNLIREVVPSVGISNNKGGSGPAGNNGSGGSQGNNGSSGNQSPPIIPREMNPVGTVGLIKDMQDDMAENPGEEQVSYYAAGEDQGSFRAPKPKVPLDSVGNVDDAQDATMNNPGDTQGSSDPSIPPIRERRPVDDNQIIKDVDDPFLDNNRNNSSIE